MKLLFVKFPFGTEMRMSQQNYEGGWSGIGMATVGIHPNDFNLNPNKIPPGGVVQNWQKNLFGPPYFPRPNKFCDLFR